MHGSIVVCMTADLRGVDDDDLARVEHNGVLAGNGGTKASDLAEVVRAQALAPGVFIVRDTLGFKSIHPSILARSSMV